MSLQTLVQNPVSTLVIGALGGLGGALLKGLIDIWTGEAKRRQDLLTHFGQQIETLAPSYYLMGNHASILSNALDNHLQYKSDLQLMLSDSDKSGSYQTNLNENRKATAAEALFAAGKLYRVITDRFWIQGGEYVVPDQWANKALEGLHNQIMRVLNFDSNVLLKYIHGKTEQREFQQKLNASETDEKLSDLRSEYVKYQDWLLKQDKEAKLLTVYARAYSDLFELEMKRLYKDIWGKTVDDPREAAEVKETSLLSDTTRELIKRAAESNEQVKQRQSALIREITNPSVVMSNASLNTGWTYYDKRQWNLAIAEYERAIAKYSDNGAAFNNLGNAYTGKRDFVGAETAYKQALTRNPENPIFNHNMAQMLSQQTERLIDALEYHAKAARLAQASRRDDSYQARIQNDRGLTLFSLEDWDRAISAFGDAIALQPLDPVLRANLAQAYEGKHGKITSQPGPEADEIAREAAVSYEIAASLATGDQAAGYFRALAGVYRKLSLWNEAIDASQKAFDAAVNVSEKAECVRQLGEVYETKGDLDRAMDTYIQAFATEGVTTCTRAAWLVRKFVESRRVVPPDIAKKSIDICLAAIQSEPGNLDHHDSLARIYFDVNDFPRFLEERDWILRHSLDADAATMAKNYNQLGLAYRKLGILDLALTYYQRAIKLHPTPEFYMNLGLFLQAYGAYDEAREPLEKARTGKQSNNFNILLSLSEVYSYGSKPDLPQAVELCRLAAQQLPDDPRPYAALAIPLQKQNLFAEAAKVYLQAASVTGRTDERADFLLKAVASYDRAIQAQPEDVEFHFRRGEMLFRLNDYKNAEEAYSRALDLAGGDRLDRIPIHNALGSVSYRQNNYDAAIVNWKTALTLAGELTPAEADALAKARLGPVDLDQIDNNLGTAYDAVNKKDEAQARYEAVVSKRPETFAGHFNLGDNLYQQGNAMRALGQFQEALRLPHEAPLSPRIFLRIGNCCFRLGWKDLAGEKWEEAAKLQAGYVEPLYNLGVLAWLSNNPEEAERRWNSAVSAAPDFLDAQYNLAVLKQQGGKTTEAISAFKEIAGKPGFEQLTEKIDRLERNEASEFEIRDIRDR